MTRRRPFTPDGRTTAERGYGWQHQQTRKEWAARHQPMDPCVRCGEPLGAMGPDLHLDHNAQRTGYAGLAHAACNRSAGVRAANAKRGRQTQPYRAPRSWHTDDIEGPAENA